MQNYARRFRGADFTLGVRSLNNDDEICHQE